MMDPILVDKHVDGEVLRPFMNNCTAIDLIPKWNIYCFYFLPLQVFDKIGEYVLGKKDSPVQIICVADAL